MTTPIERLEDDPTFQAYMAKKEVCDAVLLKLTGLDDDHLLEDDGLLLDAVAAHLRKDPSPGAQHYQLMEMVALERELIESYRDSYDKWPPGTLNDDRVLTFVADYLATAADPTDARRMVRATLAEEQGLWMEEGRFSPS